MSKIIEDKIGEYEIIRICAILKMKSNDHENILNSLRENFDDIEFNESENHFYIRQPVHSFIPRIGVTNIDIVKLIIDKLKECLEMADITIIEQRLPLAQVRYQLTKES